MRGETQPVSIVSDVKGFLEDGAGAEGSVVARKQKVSLFQ
jgi:hypothetical protein